MERANIDFLRTGGEMGALVRAFNWETSSLGPSHEWQQRLKVTVQLL